MPPTYQLTKCFQKEKLRNFNTDINMALNILTKFRGN